MKNTHEQKQNTYKSKQNSRKNKKENKRKTQSQIRRIYVDRGEAEEGTLVLNKAWIIIA